MLEKSRKAGRPVWPESRERMREEECRKWNQKGNKGPHTVGKGWYTFSVKGKIVYILNFAGHMVSFVTNQICPCSERAAIENI